FNVRFGDPETQVLTLVTDGDFAEALLAAAQGQLRDGLLQVSNDHALCVVIAAPGYPEQPTTGQEITGLARAEARPGVRVFHAGTRLVEGRVQVSGGRVLGVAARGKTLAEARDRAYAAVSDIHFEGAQFREDIGHRALSPNRDPS
ncbi:MAG TPA: phosphoribosylglycinamide synthetase C domain-containing protein, partial [Polyangiaceae bacterium]|nr:phosphoribosylglycinamide synthetase C domain-containing protein [Polyangiaceae bacterium]